MKKLLFSALLLASCMNLSAQEFYEKHIKFPENATAEQKLDLASRLVPTAQQLEWQRMELTAFLHFGINTFTGNEWGSGKEDPQLFNPTALDCDQWVRNLKDAGFKMAIITAKHHDGFCLWPTATTKHSVASSPWKNGKGDVVRELRDACKKYGIKFGVYLSPWDRNAACYGNSPEYNKFFIKQLTELLTNYGEVHEVWFDGACAEGPNGRKQEYDWEAIEKTIRTLQPKAVTAIMGDDVRWVGNEKGIGRKTEWSATVLTPGIYTRSTAQNQELNIGELSKNIGGREMVIRAKEMFWYPSEVDVSIRPGWFYHASQDNQVKSLAHLADIYFKSVGYNSVLLLNIPPDTRGLLHENDCLRLKQLRTYLDTTFSNNYLHKGDNKWQTHPKNTHIYNVKKNALVNTLMIQEDITKGQRVEDFLVEGMIDSQWQVLAEGTTIGFKRLVRFAPCKPSKIRITIRSSRGVAHILKAGIYYAQPLQDDNTNIKLGDVDVTNWKVVDNMEAHAAFDNDIQTVWRTAGLQPLTVDLSKISEITGFSYTPSPDDNLTGTIYKYKFEVSLDGKQWQECETSGEFSNIMHNPVPFFVKFPQSYKARYFRLTPLAEINAKQATSIAEIGIFASTTEK